MVPLGGLICVSLVVGDTGNLFRAPSESELAWGDGVPQRLALCIVWVAAESSFSSSHHSQNPMLD